MWDDLRTMAISRLMLDNFKNIKAYWVMPVTGRTGRTRLQRQ